MRVQNQPIKIDKIWTNGISARISKALLFWTVPVVALFKFGDIVSDLFDVIVCESFSIIFHPIDWQLNGLHCNFHFTDFYTL